MKPLLGLGALLWVATTPFAAAGSATWKLTPRNGDWNTAANWAPRIVPNGPADVATFASSSMSNLSISAGVEVAGIVFNPGVSAFTVTNLPGTALTISGTGVTNNSGMLQNFVNQEDETTSGELYFTKNATAGESVTYTNQPSLFSGGRSPLIQFADTSTAGGAQFYNQGGGNAVQAGLIEFRGNSAAANATFRNTGGSSYHPPVISFYDQASAGQALFVNESAAEGGIEFHGSSTGDHATITNEAGPDSLVSFVEDSTVGNATVINQGADFSDKGGITFFFGNATAGNGTLIADGSSVTVYGYGEVLFSETTRAGTGTFIANGGQIAGAGGGLIMFVDSATAENGTFTANGGQVAGAKGGTISFQETAAAEAGTFYANGTTVEGALGGRVKFTTKTPTAGVATLIATAGVGPEEDAGGAIQFEDDSTGAQARVEIFGNGMLDITKHKAPGATVGSIEGDGVVGMGALSLTVGSNALSTTFAGTLEGDAGSSFTKIGTGALTFNGSSTFPAVTTVAGGTLGGKGTFAGPLTVGTGNGAGAILRPSVGLSQTVTLTIQSAVTFKSDSTYTYKLSTQKRKGDEVVANGVTIAVGAEFNFTALAKKRLAAGSVFVAISNTSATPISGTFANLPDGSTLTAGRNKLLVSYTGGDGNDLTLTAQ